MINCKYWKDCQIENAGCCLLGLYGGRPSEGLCEKCQKREVIELKPIEKKIVEKVNATKIENVTTISKPCGCAKKKAQRKVR